MINESKKLKALDFNPDDQLLFRYVFILLNIWDFCHTIAPFILLSHFKNASPYEEFMILFFSALSKGNPSDRQGIFGSGRESMFFFYQIWKLWSMYLVGIHEFCALHSFNPISHSMEWRNLEKWLYPLPTQQML